MKQNKCKSLGKAHKWVKTREPQLEVGDEPISEKCTECEVKRIHYPDINEWLEYE